MRILIFIFILTLSFSGICQVDPSTEAWIQNNYNLDGAELESEVETTSIMLQPIDINNTDFEELQSLNVLTEQEILALIDYINTHGALLSIYELQAIKGLPKHKLKLIEPFIYVSSNSDSKNRLKGYSLLRIDQFLEKKKGYSQNSYAGSSQRIISRTRLGFNRILVGLTMEKDAGEIITWQPGYYGFEHITGFIEYKNTGILQKVIIGNFNGLWGQGLVLGGGFSMGKGREPIISIKRNEMLLASYSSIVEYNYMTGAGALLSLNNLKIGIFGSNRHLDGRIKDGIIVSQTSTGLHRTDSELRKRSQINQTSAGIHLAFNKVNWRIGASFIGYRLNHDFDLSRKNHNQGILRKGFLASISYKWNFKNALFYGESAISSINQLAHIHGGLFSLSHSVDAAILVRSYSKHYYSPFSSQAFGESSTASNEQGTYIGLKIKPVDNLSLSWFADVYSKPEVSSTATGKLNGTDYMLNVIWEPQNVRVQTYFRARTKEKNHKVQNTKFYTLLRYSKYYANIDVRVKISENSHLRLGSWHSLSDSDNQTTFGFLVYQELKWKIKKLSITGRISLVDVPTFDNRFYVYEPDVLYAFSIPVYYGKAIRYFFLVSYKISKSISIWIKGARTTFHDRTIIGSNLETINSRSKTSISSQVVWKF